MGFIFLGVNRPQLAINPIIMVKNEWDSTSSHPLHRHGMSTDNVSIPVTYWLCVGSSDMFLSTKIPKSSLASSSSSENKTGKSSLFDQNPIILLQR